MVAAGSPKLESHQSKEDSSAAPALSRSPPVFAARSMSDSSLPAKDQQEEKRTESEQERSDRWGLCMLFCPDDDKEQTEIEDYAQGFCSDQEARANLRRARKQRRHQKKQLSKSAPVAASSEIDGFENLQPLFGMEPRSANGPLRATQAAGLTLASQSKLGNLQSWISGYSAASVVTPSETEQISDSEQA